ncbi:10780_t:CDS:2 [Gigaspora rosea]|nr:10780_t:CDS:2 [Gigaspora rosea]
MLTPLSNKKSGKCKAQYCNLEGHGDVDCDYEKHSTSIISERIVIPSSSQHLDLRVVMCHHCLYKTDNNPEHISLSSYPPAPERISRECEELSK